MKRDALRVSLTVLAASLLLACSAQTADEHVARARELMAAGKLNEAAIELRNALQQNEESAVARQLLGEVFLQTGDAAGAVAELRKAVARTEPGEQADQLTIQLARALMAHGDWRPVAYELAMRDLRLPRQRAELKTMVATSLGMLGEGEAALAAIEDALKADASYAPARLLHARNTAGRGKAKEALSEVVAVLEGEPRNADAWVLRGELLSRLGDTAAADQAWTQALDVEPRHLGALVARVQQSTAWGKPDAIQASMAALQKAYPNHPQTVQLQVRTALAQRQPAVAREAIAKLLQVAANDTRVLRLAGEVEWRTGSRSTAQAHLQKALSLDPDDVPSRLLLAQVQASGGEPTLALQTLDRVLKLKAPPAAAFGAAGEARMQMGDAAAAESAFARATAADPKDPRWPAAQAIAGLARGADAGKSLTRLQALAQSDNSGMATLALAQAHMQRRDPASALKAIHGLEARQKQSNPMLAMVRADLLQRTGSPGKARAAYEEVLKLDSLNLSATEALCALDLADGKATAALKRMSDLAKARKTDADTQLALARVQHASGAASSEVQASLEAAARLAARDSKPALTLVAFLLDRGRATAALGVARNAQSTFPNDDQALEALAQAQMQAGEVQQALNSYRKLAVSRQQAPRVMVALAQAHVAAGEVPQARKALADVMAATPAFAPALLAQLELELHEKRWDDALTLARKQQKSSPNDVRGYVWEAMTHTQQGKWSDAAKAWRTALARQADPAVALKLHHALRRAGQGPEAAQWAEQWLAQHPRHTEMRVALGIAALEAKDYASAEARFRSVLKDHPNQVSALNNLAYTLAIQGRAGGAELAERVNSLEPERADLMDTWALALAAEGNTERALETQKKAVELNPRDTKLRLTLVKLALKQGDKSLARDQIGRLRKQTLDTAAADDLAGLARQVQ